MKENILFKLKSLIPPSVFEKLQPAYHYLLSFFAALVYRFPSRSIQVIGITGTKGKTSTTELVNAVLETAGYKTAVIGTLRFKIGEEERPNLLKMTMPGRFLLQKLMRDAVNAGCDWVVLEMTSQGVLQYRHKHISLNALIFTNLAPEHIEAHGSYENYRDAKLELAKSLSRSLKRKKAMIANVDDSEGERFIETARRAQPFPYSLEKGRPFTYTPNGIEWTWKSERIHSPLQGEFNLYNMLAAATFAESQSIEPSVVKKAFENVGGIRGRLEPIREGQDFEVYVDYAHTPDSLEQVYRAFENRNKICVLGNTGGGRDKWKRGEMARIAENYCNHIILTNEDPYDEDPEEIVNQMAHALTIPKYEIELDRRKAINKALARAEKGDVVLITGKGTDPYIMGPNNTKIPWDDATVVREELEKLS